MVFSTQSYKRNKISAAWELSDILLSKFTPIGVLYYEMQNSHFPRHSLAACDTSWLCSLFWFIWIRSWLHFFFFIDIPYLMSIRFVWLDEYTPECFCCWLSCRSQTSYATNNTGSRFMFMNNVLQKNSNWLI